MGTAPVFFICRTFAARSIMKESFYNHLTQLVGTPEDCTFLLTVSGGGDSVVMAHLFHSSGLKFAIAHCNFHLRGDDSDEDMRFVQQLAANYGVQLFVKEFDTFSIQKNSGKSVEMVARDLRYQWFEEVGQPFDFIVTAHHANDNAETLLLNLCRGTGLKGLTGIPARNGKYLRPLLPFLADELRNYATRHHLAFRTDQTNFSEQYQRNKIRLAVLPKLTEINPDLIRTFTRNADHFRHQYDFYQRQIAAFKQEMVSLRGDEIRISIRKLSENPDKELLLYVFLKEYNFTAATARDIAQRLDGNAGKLFFSDTHCLLKDRDFLIIKKKEEETANAEITVSSWEELEELGFSVESHEVNGSVPFERDLNVLYVDAAKIAFPLTLRHWREGDAFQPFGMYGTKKLSDLFKDAKSSRFDKQKTWILCCKEEIVWVVGFRSDRRFCLDFDTKQFYKIKYHGRI